MQDTTRSDRSRKQDRAQVAAGQEHEVAYFARKHGITKEQTLELIRTVGNDREALDAAAAELTR